MKAAAADPVCFFNGIKATKVDCAADFTLIFQVRTEATTGITHFQSQNFMAALTSEGLATRIWPADSQQ